MQGTDRSAVIFICLRYFVPFTTINMSSMTILQYYICLGIVLTAILVLGSGLGFGLHCGQLTVSTQTAYACRRCFQDLDTGSKRLEALSQSISKLEGSFSSSEYYPLAVRTTTIFTQPFDSYPKSLAMTLCMRNGSTVSLTKGSSISAVRTQRTRM